MIRASAKDCFYRAQAVDRDRWRDGRVLLWPQTAQGQQQPPLHLRLLRVRARKAKHAVWLLTNILDAKRLSAATAGRSYRWRWENEVFSERTSGRWLLLLAQGACALPRRRTAKVPLRWSARVVLREIRRELQAALPRRRPSLRRRLQQAYRKPRRRLSKKEKREWPRRKKHAGSQPPKCLVLSERQKALQQKIQRE